MKIAVVANDGFYLQGGYGIRCRLMYESLAASHRTDMVVLRVGGRKKAPMPFAVTEVNALQFGRIRRILSDYQRIVAEGISVATLLSFLGIGPFIYDMHGLAEEECSSRAKSIVYRHAERRVLRRAGRVLFVSRAMRRYSEEKHELQLESRSAVVRVHPSVRPTTGSATLHDQCASARAALSIPLGVPVIVYAGSTAPYQEVELMIDFLEALDPPWRIYVLTRDPGAFTRIASRPNTVLTEADEPLLRSIYSAADYGLILRSDSPVNQVASPTKMIEYLAFGLTPVVWRPFGDFWDFGVDAVSYEELLETGPRPGKNERNVEVANRLLAASSDPARAVLQPLPSEG